MNEPKYQTLPFPPPPFRVSLRYDVPDLALRSRGLDTKIPNVGSLPVISAPVMVAFTDQQGSRAEASAGRRTRLFRRTGARRADFPIANGSERSVKVGVSSNLTGASGGTLRLEAPEGWRIEPEEIPVQLRQRGDKKHFEFKVVPGSLKEGHTQIRAVLAAGGKNYSEGYTLVTRDDLAAAYYYQPALQRVSIVDVKVPKGLKVAYIPGAGDEIPTVCSRSALT